MISYIKKTLSVFATQVAILPITLITGILIARFLGPEGKGLLALIVLILTLLKLLGSLGLEFSNVYFISRNKNQINNVFTVNILITILANIVLILLLFFFRKSLIDLLLPTFDSKFFCFLYFLFLPFLWLNLTRTIFQGLENFKLFNILKFVEPAIKLIAIIMLVVIFKFGILGGMYALSLSLIIPAICATIFLLRKSKPKLSINRRFLRDTVKYGIKGQIGLFFQFFNYRFDMFLVSYFLSISAVGYYSISVTIAELLWYIPSSIATTLFPKIASQDKQTANRFICGIVSTSILILAITTFVVGIFAPLLIPVIYGRQFSQSTIPLQVLLPGIFAFGLVKILTSYLHGRGKPHYGSIVTVCSLIITILLDFILIPQMQITGAALATSVAYISSLILTIIFFTRNSGLRLHEFIIPSLNKIKTTLALVNEAKK